MPLTDREAELLRLLELYLGQLQVAATKDPTTISPFGPEDAAVQRWLQLAIQCCLDLGDSYLGKSGVDEPPRYRDIFPALVRLKVIDEDLARRMERLTGFRNALAHAYSELSPNDTWRQLKMGLSALAEFARMMALQ